MYKKVTTQRTARLENGENIKPVATMKNEYGGVAHVWIDDGCYVLGLESPTTKAVLPTHYIFPEALALMQTLPALK
jgi:hypothetical protein